MTDLADVLFLGDPAGFRNCAVESQLRIATCLIDLLEQHCATPASLICVDARPDRDRAIRRLAAIRAVPALDPVPVAAFLRAGDAARRALVRLGFTECVTSLTALSELRRQLHVFPERLSFHDLELDTDQYKVWRGGRLILLPTFQFRLLKFLMTHPSRIFSRRELLDQVWRDSQVNESAVTACLARLRRALAAEGEPDLIRNARGSGYALDVARSGDVEKGAAQPSVEVTKASFQLHRGVTPDA